MFFFLFICLIYLAICKLLFIANRNPPRDQIASDLSTIADALRAIIMVQPAAGWINASVDNI